MPEDGAQSQSLSFSTDQVPMPMESQETLQRFALPEDSANNNSPEDIVLEESMGEGWYKRYLKWLNLELKWVPTSASLLEQAERNILSYVRTKYDSFWVDITPKDETDNAEGSSSSSGRSWYSSWCKQQEEIKIWTLAFNKESDKLPMLMVHGLCASVGLWAFNIDPLAEDRPVYAIDLIGFGRSSRPKFPRDAMEAELQHVEAIEAWRKRVGLDKFVLLGHSMGAFISTSYALKYPERVAHLILADPWGMPEKPENVEQALPVNRGLKLKAVTTIGQLINPLGLVRAAGPLGPGLIGKARPDLMSKFEPLNQDGKANVGEYIYHSNAQNPTGEEAFRTMMNFFGWAKNPMCHRIKDLDPKLPVTFMYGENTWLQQLNEKQVKEVRQPGAYTEVHVIPGAGHHVYADNQSAFNTIVKAAAFVDSLILKQS